VPGTAETPAEATLAPISVSVTSALTCQRWASGAATPNVIVRPSAVRSRAIWRISSSVQTSNNSSIVLTGWPMSALRVVSTGLER